MDPRPPGSSIYTIAFAVLLVMALPFYDLEEYVVFGLGNIVTDIGVTFMVIYLAYIVHGLLRVAGNSTERSSSVFFIFLLIASFLFPSYSVSGVAPPDVAFILSLIFTTGFALVIYSYTKKENGKTYLGIFLLIALQLTLLLSMTDNFRVPYNSDFFGGSDTGVLALTFVGIFFLLFAWLISRWQLGTIRRARTRSGISSSSQRYTNNASPQGQPVGAAYSGGHSESVYQNPPNVNPNGGNNQQQVYSGQGKPNVNAGPSSTPRVQYDKNSNTVAVVGYSGGGKTTLITLFVYASAYINEIPGYSFTLESVSPVLRDSIKGMLSGEWPSGTMVGELRTETNMTLSRKSGIRTKKVDLRLNDASGETWARLAEEGETPQALNRLISTLPQVAYLKWTSQYIVTIDCENYSDWITLQFDYLNIFKSLYYLNGKKKVKKPVAVVFTKYDRLPDEAKSTSLETLLKRDLSHIYQYLIQHFSISSVRTFRIGIEVTEENKPRINLVNGIKSLTIKGGAGPYGQLPDLVRWMLED